MPLELEEGIDGFLHDDLSWTKKVRNPSSELTVDQEWKLWLSSPIRNPPYPPGVKQPDDP